MARTISNRGQVKMFESIGVLIIFFFLLSFGFTFYGKMQKISNEKKMQKAIELDAISLAIKTSSLPELQCSVKNVNEPNCYDEYKLEAFMEMMGESGSHLTDHYFEVLDYSRVDFEVVYPSQESYHLYERTRAEGSGTAIANFIPMTLYDPVSGEYKFGYLNVTYYAET